MKRVLIESPLKGNGDPEEYMMNKEYARMCMKDSLERGEAPYASHLLFDQYNILEDNIPEQRKLGIEAGLIWGAQADLTAVYIDRGISEEMRLGIDRAKIEGRLIEERSLGEGINQTLEAMRESLLRQTRLTNIGKLSMDNGILILISTGNKDVLFQMDSLALHEALGLLEFARMRGAAYIARMVGMDAVEKENTGEINPDSRPS